MYDVYAVCTPRADVPFMFKYGDDVHANRSVLFDLDKIVATSVVKRLDQVNWFNRNYGVCVLELILYTPYSDLLTQVAPHLLLIGIRKKSASNFILS